MPHKDPLIRKNYQKKFEHDYVIRLKKAAYVLLGDKCVCCGETIVEFLSIDHIKNDGHVYRKAGHSTTQVYQDIIKNQCFDKYQLLCMNCQWGKRSGQCPHQKEKS
jgi:hypothetical protein